MNVLLYKKQCGFLSTFTHLQMSAANNMKKRLTKQEIKKRLQWFHGEDFEKYPFIEEETKQTSRM